LRTVPGDALSLRSGGPGSGDMMQRPESYSAAGGAGGGTAAAPEAPAFVNLATVSPDVAALHLVPRVVAERFRLVPMERRGDSLTVAMVDPGDVITIDEIAR